jgi:hypothetical protein
MQPKNGENQMKIDELKEKTIDAINQAEGLTRNDIIRLVASDIGSIDIIDFIAEIEADKRITILHVTIKTTKTMFFPSNTIFDYHNPPVIHNPIIPIENKITLEKLKNLDSVLSPQPKLKLYINQQEADHYGITKDDEGFEITEVQNKHKNIRKSDVNMHLFIETVQRVLKEKHMLTVKDMECTFENLGRNAMRSILLELTRCGIILRNPVKMREFEFFQTSITYDDIEHLVQKYMDYMMGTDLKKQIENYENLKNPV